MHKIYPYLRLLALLVGLTTSLTLLSEAVGEQQALEIAARLMPGKSWQAVHNNSHRAPGRATAYHLLNASDQGGYVIVAGDDRVPPVLAYSDHGTLEGELPEALEAWLDGYAAQIEALNTETVPDVPRHLAGQPAIAPLVPARWNQGTPYNILLPYVSGKHASTGCVATAMAQIMYTHRHPARPTATVPEYTTSTNSIYMPALEPVDFDWSAMKDIYYTDDTIGTAATAVATLMKYCAQSVRMNFLASSSGSQTSRIPAALATYFGYKPSARYLGREGYSTEQWEQMLYDELAAGRPVAYGGNKVSGGHAFVCDGYDGNGMFHINWGWGSQSDGYFLLNVLNPSSQGIGSVAGAYGYIMSQGMGIGLEPGTDGTHEQILTYRDMTTSYTYSSRSSASGTFSVTVSGRYYNYTSATGSFDLGWGFYDADGNLVTKLYSSYTTNLAAGSYISTNSRTLTFGANLTSGTYRIVPICAVRNSGNWVPCAGSDVNYIEVTINSATRCTIVGHGTAGTPSYTFNSATFDGTRHPNKAVNVALNLTNKGITRGDMVYMFVDDEFTSAGMADMLPGETGDVIFRFVPETASRKKITFSLSDTGSPVLATQYLNITAMPEAQLEVTARVLNVTDEEGRIVTSDRFGVEATVTNTGTTTYDEDFSFRCYRVTYGNYGTIIQTQSQALQLAPGESKVLTFECDNVMNDFKYFAWLYYYSAGELIQAHGTSIYTVRLAEQPPTIPATSVTLSDTVAVVPVGETLQLSATVLPDDASNRTVTWSSSDEAIATVDASGLVTAVAAGTATITATTCDGTALTASCTVTVPAPAILPDTIELSEKAFRLQLNNTHPVRVVTPGVDAVAWSSSNEAIASVDADGVVTAHTTGIAIITATAPNGASVWCAVFSYLPGDANENNTVDVSDVNQVVNIILGKE